MSYVKKLTSFSNKKVNKMSKQIIEQFSKVLTDSGINFTHKQNLPPNSYLWYDTKVNDNGEVIEYIFNHYSISSIGTYLKLIKVLNDNKISHKVQCKRRKLSIYPMKKYKCKPVDFPHGFMVGEHNENKDLINSLVNLGYLDYSKYSRNNNFSW
jgi:hypothetical protein